MSAGDLVIIVIPFIIIVVLLYFYFKNLVIQFREYINERNEQNNNNNPNPIVIDREEDIVRILIVKSPNKYFNNDSKDTCPICIETMEIGEGQEELASMGCEHTYHKDCIVEWLKINRTCPICRL